MVARLASALRRSPCVLVFMNSSTTSSPELPPTPQPQAGTGRHAQRIAFGILLSRMMGLVREMVFAKFFGTSLYADVFRVALRMPNALQNLLGEGTLSASFIPVYAKLLEEGREEDAGRVAGAVFALLVAIAGVLTLIGVLLAPILVSIGAPGFTGVKRELTITCTRIIFPMAGILVLSAWSLGVLNSHRRFFLPYVAPVLWNAAMIAALIWFGGRQSDRELVVTLAWGAFVGGLLQFSVQVPAVLKLERKLKIALDLKLQGVQQALRTAGHAVSGRGVVQLSGWVDNVFASLMGMGAVASLGYAQILYMLPISLFGISVAAAELPELARQRGGAVDQLVRRVNSGLAQIAVLVVPSMVGYLLLGDIIVAALFERGQFTRESTFIVTLVLIAYAIGLIASTATRLFSSAFFALADTRTPARIAWLRVAVSAALGGLVTLYLVVPAWMPFGDRALLRFGPVALALASALGAWLEWYLLRSTLRTRLPGIGLGRALLVKLLGVAVGAALVARGLALLLRHVPDLQVWVVTISRHTIIGAIVITLYAVLYLAVVHALGIETRIPLIGRFFKRSARP
jgi:putative peptidoglycan lipid II flippase